MKKQIENKIEKTNRIQIENKIENQSKKPIEYKSNTNRKQIDSKLKAACCSLATRHICRPLLLTDVVRLAALAAVGAERAVERHRLHAPAEQVGRNAALGVLAAHKRRKALPPRHALGV